MLRASYISRIAGADSAVLHRSLVLGAKYLHALRMDLLCLSSSWLAEVEMGSVRLDGCTLADLDIWTELELPHLALRRLDVPSPHKQHLVISINNGSLRGLPTQIHRTSSSWSLITAILSCLVMVGILLSNQVDNRLLHSALLCELPNIRLRWELVHAL